MAHRARTKTRAARRIAERTRRNAEAVAAGIAIAEERPKRRYARTKTVLETLAARGAITMEQRAAGDRLARDYHASNTLTGRLTASYEPRMRSRMKYQATPDTPLSAAARERFDHALGTAGRWLAPILIHTCITDLPPSGWGPLNGKAPTDGIALLRLGLDALCWHYGGHRQAA